MRKLDSGKTMFLACVFCVVRAIPAPAQAAWPLATLVNFNLTNGGQPEGSLIQGADGNFYGTTAEGGANSYGTVFKMTPTGTLTTLYSFCSQPNCADGYAPVAGLVQGTDGNFYGTTQSGGIFEPVGSAVQGGTVFKITPAGVLTTLYSFCSEVPSGLCTDGDAPVASLVQGNDGNFYGVTQFGGGYGSGNGSGTIFKITPAGVLNKLYSFCSQPGCPDGSYPASIVQASNGTFYGTTSASGSSGGFGTLFKFTPAGFSGTLTTLYNFCGVAQSATCGGPLGASPTALVQASNGNLYGTTESGGANGGGTVFAFALGGALTTLYNFCSQPNCTDGEGPTAVLRSSNGNLYGTTSFGGAYPAEGRPKEPGYGTVFEITAGGALTTLHNFDVTDGADPTAVVQGSNGNLYGATELGGTSADLNVPLSNLPNGVGTVFTLPESVPGVCNGLIAYYIFTGDLQVSNGDVCQFFGGEVTGNVIVTGGTLVLENTSIGGNLQIQGGVTFALGPSVRIGGNLQIQNLPDGPPANAICGVDVSGNLQFQNNATAVQIGSASPGCPGNVVGGNLQIMNNTAPTQVFDNTISNHLQCQNNTNITGGGNTAQQKQNQCASF